MEGRHLKTLDFSHWHWVSSGKTLKIKNLKLSNRMFRTKGRAHTRRLTPFLTPAAKAQGVVSTLSPRTFSEFRKKLPRITHISSYMCIYTNQWIVCMYKLVHVFQAIPAWDHNNGDELSLTRQSLNLPQLPFWFKATFFPPIDLSVITYLPGTLAVLRGHHSCSFEFLGISHPDWRGFWWYSSAWGTAPQPEVPKSRETPSCPLGQSLWVTLDPRLWLLWLEPS